MAYLLIIIGIMGKRIKMGRKPNKPEPTIEEVNNDGWMFLKESSDKEEKKAAQSILKKFLKKPEQKSNPEPKSEQKPLPKPEPKKEYDEQGNEINFFRKIGRSLLHKQNISSSELHRIASEQAIKTYRYEGYIKFLSFRRLGNWYKNKYLRGRLFFIIMQLKNGKYDMFTIRSINPYFEHRGGMYFIDPDMAREDLHTRNNVLFYHQDFAAPFKIMFDVTKVHDVIMASDEENVIDKSLNPSTFKYVINSQVIEKLIKAHEIADKLKLLVILVIVNIAVTALIGILIAKSSGML